jgi:beta-glucanase (GH16 family)
MLYDVDMITLLALASVLMTPDYKLVWSDEFDKPGLPDPAKWGYEYGFLRNAEKQFYTRGRLENARVEGGRLIIEARKDNFEGHEVTSASLTTEGKANWTYGKFEARLKLPTGRGTWPAFWMLGTNIREVGWPKCGEIDIMENVGYDPDKVHGTIHTDAYNHTKNTGRGKSVDMKPYEDFHTYTVEWLENRIDFFVDGRKYHSFAKESDDPAVWPFNKPQYMILNLAIGGGWGGQKGIDDAIFPARYEIDYVRVWQKK